MSCSSSRHGSWTGLYFAIGVMALSAAPPALATGPTLPLRFDDAPGTDAWSVGVLVDHEQIGAVRVGREVYADGRQVRAEPISTREERLSIGGRPAAGMRLPLDFRGMDDLRRTPAFAQKIVLDGRWVQQPAAQALRVQRWFYFAVRDGRIVPIGREEYARITDPAERAADSGGRPVTVQRGTELASPVPLPATGAAFDRQVTANRPAAEQGRATARAVSEADER
jgi:hypothetical protein